MALHHNKLKHETSPYLLQHANNPVHWFAWGTEALEAAKAEQKPILISIGYAACHWCHVMEKESFENKEVAVLMNKNFINIKIDREERPDLDHIYMDAVQAIAGNGGWPLNVFLTPEAKPFYGGTYFPPQPAHGRNSWTEVLVSINEAWTNRREEVEAQAENLTGHIKKSNDFAATKSTISLPGVTTVFSKDDCVLIAENILKNADYTEGGFGAPPKFPQTFCLQYLLQHAHFFNDKKALEHAEFSLQKMMDGGIYDQLGGGMARYSTDARWLAPHFEKMLYDNALLIIVLCDAYQLTKKDFYATAIRHIIDFIDREMKHESGGYYAAIDADSEGEEGKFYVWQKNEIDTLLGEHSAMYCAYYNIIEEGNWESNNILHITNDATIITKQFDKNIIEFKKIIDECNAVLLSVRNKRIRPITDDKILLGWNALLLTAFCRAYASLQEDSYKAAAIELYNFIEAKFKNKDENSLFHTYKNAVAKFPAFLDDYAFYIQACIHLQEITGDQSYLLRAKAYTGFVIENFSDDDSDFFFYTHKDQKDIIVRKQELYDGATPSANAVMAGNLQYLGIIFDSKEWQSLSTNMVSALLVAIKKYPSSFAVWATVMQHRSAGIKEIAVTGTNVEVMLKQLLNLFIPNKVIQSATGMNDEMPLLKGKLINQITQVYLCTDYQCKAPVTDLKSFVTILIKN